MRFIALSLIATLCGAQTPILPAQTSAPSPAAAGSTITVPQGTAISLTLVSTVRSKSTKPGDPVRAMVAFPVAIGAQVAIPAGAFVEGTVKSLKGPNRHSMSPGIQMHFTRLVFAHGYSVPLDAINNDALLFAPELVPHAQDFLADARDGAPYFGEQFSRPGETAPEPPPLPSNGPNPAVITGAVLGGAALVTIFAILAGRRHAAGVDTVLFQSGWQFQMTLQQPLTLDAAMVSASGTAGAAQ